MKVYPPTIHMNGTSATTFTKAYNDAANHIRCAIATLAEIRPHMRDFYIREDGEEQHRLALLNHDIRLSRLEKTIEEITALHLAVIDQVKP